MELRLEPFLDAFATTSQVGEVFGPLLTLAQKNDEANFAKVRAASGKLGEPPTVRALLAGEKGTGAHKPGGVLAEPSAAIALLWMRRTLQFLRALLEGLAAADEGAALAGMAKDAYGKHLEPYHSWLLKNTFRMGLGGVPKRDDVLRKLGPTLSDAERDRTCIRDMGEVVRLLGVVVDSLRRDFAELDLEDTRKV